VAGGPPNTAVGRRTLTEENRRAELAGENRLQGRHVPVETKKKRRSTSENRLGYH